MEFNKLPTKIINGKRHYVTPSGKICPSITTILATIPNPELDEWRKKVGEPVADHIKIQASIRGEQVHNIICDYLEGMSDSDLRIKYTRLLPMALFQNIREIIDKISKINLLEKTIWSDKLEVAGRVDCIAEYDGEVCVIDFKTATKLKQVQHITNHFLQTSFYSLAYEELTGNRIPRLVIIMSCESGEKNVFIGNRYEYEEQLMQVIGNYKSGLSQQITR